MTPPVRPHLYDRVHAALLKAGRPVTRGELRMFIVNNQVKAANVQAALDALVSDGLAERGEEPGRRSMETFVVWRAVGKERR